MGSSSDQETPIGTEPLLHTWWVVEQHCRRNDENMCRVVTPYVQVLEKLRKWKSIYSLLCESRDNRDFTLEKLSPSISSVSTEQWRSGTIKSLLETVELLNQDPKNNVPPELVSHFTEHETPDVRRSVRGDSSRIQAERYKNIPRTEKFAQVCREAGFAQIVECWQYFVTTTAIWLEQMGLQIRVENTPMFEMHPTPSRKGFFGTT